MISVANMSSPIWRTSSASCLQPCPTSMRHHIRVAHERYASRGRPRCLNHLQGPNPVDAAVRAHPDMIMQRDRLVFSRAKRVIDIVLRLTGTAWLPDRTLILAVPAHSRRRRSASCSENPKASTNSSRVCLLSWRPAKCARHSLSKLIGHHCASPGPARSRPKLAYDHLGDGHLVDDVVPRPAQRGIAMRRGTDQALTAAAASTRPQRADLRSASHRSLACSF